MWLGTSLLITLVCYILSVTTVLAQYADVLSIAIPSGGIRVNEPITVHIESPSLELETALILWTLDGAEIRRGIGATHATLTVTNSAQHQLTSTVIEKNGVTRTEKTTIQASAIDILWEAATLTPPLYKGRSLPSAQSTILAEALTPSSTDDTPTTYIYTWKLDNRVLADKSGISKNSIEVPFPMFQKSVLLQVSVRKITGDFVGDASVRIETTTPFVVFYEKKPLIGVWTNTALLTTTPSSNEKTIIAYPFFLSAYSPQDTRLHYEWAVSSRSTQPADSTASPAEATIHDSDQFKVRVTHSQYLLQDVQAAGRLLPTGTTKESEVFGITE